MTMSRVACIALGLLAACAPAQRRLLTGHHYEAALASAAHGELAGGAVLAAIERELEPGLHLQAVPASELRAHLGGNLGLEGVVLVRVIHDANQIPIDRLEVSLSLLHRSDLLPPIEPDPETLAALTGQTITATTPRSRPVGFLDRIGRVAATVVQAGGAVFSQPSSGPQSAAAEALRQWLQPPSCNGGLGQLCRSYDLWPRPRLGGDAPLELAVSLGIGGRGDTAILYRLAIPPGAFEGGLQAMFGDRERTLDDLYRRHGRARILIHPLAVLAADPRGGFTHASRALLKRRVLGTRTDPGLRAHPGLRFRIFPDRLPTPASPQGSARTQAAELRLLLLSLGVSDQQIEIADPTPGAGPEGGLQVQYELALAPVDPARG